MLYRQVLVIVTSQDYLCSDSVLACEQITVTILDTTSGIDRVATSGNELLSCRSGLLQIPFRGVTVQFESVIFPESSLEQASPALQSESRPLRHLVHRVFDWKMRNSKVQILNHMGHHQLT